MLTRRRFLVATAGGLLAACTRNGDGERSATTPSATSATSTSAGTGRPASTSTTARPRVDGPAFTLGVAAGDPAPDGFVLWTRLLPESGPPEGDVDVGWEVSTTPGFTDVVAHGTATARTDLGHSVHVEVAGLEPGREHWYRFLLGDEDSPAGRARTLPEAGAAVGLFRFAFASCQNWQAGWWPALAHLADEDLDLVVHLGDYVYEGAASGEREGRRHLPGHACETLDDYRARYAQYKGDPALQAAHAAAAWVVAWDDHEVVNNVTAGTVDPARRAAAYQAWYEHQPVRLGRPPASGRYDVHRGVDVGRLARFHVLDTRQHRSDQACGRDSDLGGPCSEVDDPARTVLGPDQEAWLASRLRDSGATWDVIAQQVVMARLDLFPGPGEVLNLDQWDGYPAARQRLLDVLAEGAAANPVVVTGDIHAAGAADLLADFADPSSPVVGAELVGPAVSSGFPEEFADVVRAAVEATPWGRYFEAHHRGYVRCTLDERRWLAEYRYVESVDSPSSPVSTGAAFVVEAGRPGVHPA